MPFYGQEWRDPGTFYIKNESGRWESAKLFRNSMLTSLKDQVIRRRCKISLTIDDDSNDEFFSEINDVIQSYHQPMIIMKKVSTRENLMQISLDEALKKLDMQNAINDIRRFNYVFQIVRLLLVEKLQSISGTTQIALMELLRAIMQRVLSTKSYIHLLTQLLTDFKCLLESENFEHIGCSKLWQSHLSTVRDMLLQLHTLHQQLIEEDQSSACLDPSSSSSSFPSSSSSSSSRGELRNARLLHLPPECIQQILRQLASPLDLANASKTCSLLNRLVEDALLWKKLVICHFTHQQLAFALKSVGGGQSFDDCNWKKLYIRLLKCFGDNHFYPAKLVWCFRCHAVFWNVLGHQCGISEEQENQKEMTKDLSPRKFVELFKI